MNDKHLLIFFARLLIFGIIFVACGYILSACVPGMNGDDPLGSILGGAFGSDVPEQKEELLSFLFGGERQYTVTAETIDLSSGKIWVGEGQKDFIELYMFSCLFTAVVFLLAGIGRVYEFLRHIMGVCMSAIFAVGLFILPLMPFSLVLMMFSLIPFMLFATVLGLLLPITLPIGLIVQLVLGIIDVVRFFRERSAAACA